jgi:hypothetical protein
LVNIGSGSEARTLMPSFGGYKFTFELEEKRVVLTSSGTTLRIELEVGTWKLTVAELDKNKNEIAWGTAEVPVEAGQISPVTVKLTLPGGVTSLFKYAITFPASVSIASLTITPLSGGSSPPLPPIDLLSKDSASTTDGVIATGSVEKLPEGSYLATGSVENLPEGFYLVSIDILSVDLDGRGGNMKKNEVMHIYNGITTMAAGKTYNFTTEDFTPTTYTTGSGETLSNILDGIATADGTDFTVVLNGDKLDFTPFILDGPAYKGKRIRLYGEGEGKSITLAASNGSLFTVGPNVTLVLRDITLQGRSNNNASLVTVNGGDLVMEQRTAIIDNTTGGGVSVDGSGTFTMNGGEISSNSDGGVYVDDNATFTMYGGKISSNSADSNSDGGGVSVDGNATFTMYGGEISGNSADSDGGGVFVDVDDGTFTMYGGEISGNTTGKNGGGVCVKSGIFTMSGGTIGGNIAKNGTGGGGGVFVSSGVTFTMTGGTIKDNTAEDNGGGVYVDDGTFTMYGGEISRNAATKNGGGVYVNKGTFSMSEGTISGNIANTGSGGGGGVYVSSGVTFTMTGGTIKDNTAEDNGGGLFVSGTFIMSGGTIGGNIARNSRGGGVLLYNGGTFTMSGGTISGNQTYSNGGGVCFLAYEDGGDTIFTMTGGSISGNIANNNGGGVYVDGGGIFTKSASGNAVIYGFDDSLKNTATSGKGHAVYVYVEDGDKQRQITAGAGYALDSRQDSTGGGWE